MNDTTQEEPPPYDIVDPGRFGYGWRADTIRPYITTLKAENAEAKRYNRYYLDILNRIANGYDSPASLAKLAQTWAIHTPECGYNKGDWGECDCGAEDRVEAHAEAAQSQAAAMAGLLEEARTEIMHWTGGHEATSTKSYLNNLLPRIDAALAAWKAKPEDFGRNEGADDN